MITLSSEASVLDGWVSACTYFPNIEMDVLAPKILTRSPESREELVLSCIQ